MKKILVVLLLLALAFSITLDEINPIHLISQMKASSKGSLSKETQPILTIHGTGVTDGQETMAINFVLNAYQIYGKDTVGNAKYIQKKVEDAFGGKWNVEVYGDNPAWGRATYIKNDQWIFLYREETTWYYVIWAPDC